ncbi:class I adenylate-forming enzyme family protein [Sphingomonas sp.]|uniref:class I adenylate-forming enzyme family protein n=1 Tax=Sphingomonas sp. TaxID=28214 RepID=UPI001DB33658|nr:class I adenylate-forming enzyme family protein [Sphingomonas sp.]MBX9796475.1 acyl--CoA ligase [Sphingomonas sp.]
MPSLLDQQMDAVLAALTAPGGQMPVVTTTRDGRDYPMIAAAPPALTYYFAHFCAEHHNKTFLVAGEERLSFAEVYAIAGQVARALVDGHGVQRGDRVGIAMRNSPSWIALYMGILMAGGVATLLNGWWQTAELAAAIAEVECALVFADAPRAQRLDEATGLSANVVPIDDRLPLAQALAGVIARGGTAETQLPMLTGEDNATILFTSGSTGQSKGALADHRGLTQAVFNYLAQAVTMLTIATQMGQPPQGQPSTLLNVPLFHVTAEVPVFLQSFAMGRKLVLMPKWDAEEAMRLIEREQISYFVGVPLMSFEILTHPNRHKYNLTSVTDFAAGGAPRPVEHVKRIHEELPGAPLLGYGLTETNGVGCGNFRDNYLAKPNSTGRPSYPLVELAILDGAGQPVAQGARGEVAIRSICNFKGYWNRPEATRDAFTADQFFLTGDIGYLDEDGYLFIVDRKKDIIIRGGENISCQEVEAALYENPAVAEAAVFGLPDDRYGEVPGAVVHIRAGEVMDAEALCEFLAGRIAAFKVPARIWLSPAPLPRLGTEKIDKVALRTAYRERHIAERAA